MSLFIFTTPKDFSTDLILKEARKQSLDCSVIYYSNIKRKNKLLFDKNKPVLVGKKDNILLRDPYQGGNFSLKMRKILKEYYQCVLLDRRCFKKHPQYEDKLFQAKFFRKNKISAPETYFLKQIAKIKAFPIVAKRRISSRGKGNFLINNRSELNNFLKRQKQKDFVLQGYKKIDRDYRVLIFKNKILGTVSRIVSFKKDKTIKVRVEKEDNGLPECIKQDALRTSKKLGSDFVGIDLIFSRGKYYLLEANLAPQFKSFTRVTGINVAKRIIDIYTQHVSETF